MACSAASRGGIGAAMKSVVILACPWRDPTGVLAAVADEPFAVALLSGGEGERSRWSYVAARPAAVLSNFPGDPADPVLTLRTLLGEAVPGDPEGPPFQGGVAGLFAMSWATVRAARPGAAGLAGPGLRPLSRAAGLRPRGRGGSWRSGAARPPTRRTARAVAALAWLDLAPRAARAAGRRGSTASSPDAYEAAVASSRAPHRRGRDLPGQHRPALARAAGVGPRPIDLMSRLAQPSPAPFAAYLRLPGQRRGVQLAGAVPAGRPTEAAPWSPRPSRSRAPRPRGATPAEDARLAAELLASAKDRAENLMIVDLMRNDLSRVCTPGAVAGPNSSGSQLRQRPPPGLDGHRRAGGRAAAAGDLLRAAFPPGSITGAPKVQAMKVIAALEAAARSLLRRHVLGRLSTARWIPAC